MAETARFPEGAAQHYDVMFTEVTTRLAAYLRATFHVSARASLDVAHQLLGQLLFPRLTRALFGLEDLVDRFDEHAVSAKIDVRAIRKVVTNVVESLPGTP
jgi:hypothetical protein